ncbi:MAG: CAP domain-containing protein [Butyrivibrio sp.]|nr:CAP domain-containing protein [Butyrivibrio sp.]
MKNFKKLFTVMFACVFAFSCVACGSVNKGALDNQAATRGADEGAGEIYIDDGAIALAGSASSSQASIQACAAVFDLINQERASKGLPALAWSDALTTAAQVRATEIQTEFSHTRPGGDPFWTVDSNVQYGENLAKLYPTADTVFTAWMNSPTHAANIMDGGYKTVGIALCYADDGSPYWAQEFGY